MFSADQEEWINKRLNKDSYKAIGIILHDAYGAYLRHICKDNDDPYLEFSSFLSLYDFNLKNGRVCIKKRGMKCPEE